MAVLTINKNFDETVLKSSEPVVVDFWAPWCGYCRRLSPAVDRLEAEYEGKIKVAKLDIDTEEELAEKYEVDTIPTLILFKNGEMVDSVVNPPSQDAIEEWLKENGAL
ncbi:thioredoxin [[Clostridium] symbiosum]|uniref:thioredoxin n=1 Tax=Clostridium symbiosum TaxID=1512 RepID=UPI001D074C8D|nr:thioredoxin [[Clostridium] symbiosum]MCB6611603.1 thioredoxin [[Clostridium] symbiosum]MCB6932256.1 thioredoxin [[Clostridium] symbiosum]